MPAYNVLTLGASYGSLLATKLLLAGHKVKLVCLPAEVEVINAEGTRVRLPVKGRASWSSSIRASCRAAVRRPARRRQSGRLRSGRAGDAGAAVPLARRARTARRGREGQGAVHVDHEHAAAALPEAHSRPRRRRAAALPTPTPTVWDNFDPACMTLCSPDPQAFRPPEEKVNVLQVTLPTNFKVGPLRVATRTPPSCASWSGHRGDPLRPGRRRHRAAGQAQGARLDLRAARQVGDADGRQLPLRHQGRRDRHQGRGARATSQRRARSTTGCGAVRGARRRPRATWCRSRNTPTRPTVWCARPRRPARSTTAPRTSSGPTGWCSWSRAQYGMHNDVVDRTVAQVDARLAANRKAPGLTGADPADWPRAPVQAVPAGAGRAAAASAAKVPTLPTNDRQAQSGRE